MLLLPRLALLGSIVVVAACGPGVRNSGDDGPDTDAAPPVCTEGASEGCYSGLPGTAGTGPCMAGSRTCVGGLWTSCQGEVIPQQETCGDGIDNNCNGTADENVDLDGDGFTTCDGDCCDSTECSDPTLVNPGSFDAAGNMLDDDCDGTADNTVAACDTGIPSNTTNAVDFAKAIDLCQTATMADRKWGVISASLTLANGMGSPNAKAHAVRPRFGTGTTPRAGAGLAILSTGAAAATGDTNPAFQDFETGAPNGTSSPFPADYATIPNAPGCPPPNGTTANDPVMLTLRVRVPTNAKSFKLATNFFSSEFPEYTCSAFNDFFVILLDSTYTGTPANPADKNLAFYEAPNMMKYPVGVNLASGNTGLFRQCTNGPIGCMASFPTPPSMSINTCTSTAELAGTGMDTPGGNLFCTAANIGGATGWLETSGNVVGGEIITLRIAIWDMSDSALDSVAVIDAFQWSVDAAEPGTVIF